MPYSFINCENLRFLYYNRKDAPWEKLCKNIKEGIGKLRNKEVPQPYPPVYIESEAKIFIPLSGINIFLPRHMSISFNERGFITEESSNLISAFLNWCDVNGISKFITKPQEKATYTRSAKIYNSIFPDTLLETVYEDSYRSTCFNVNLGMKKEYISSDSLRELIEHFISLIDIPEMKVEIENNIYNLISTVPIHYITVLDCGRQHRVFNVFTNKEEDCIIKSILEIGTDAETKSVKDIRPKRNGIEDSVDSHLAENGGKNTSRVINPDLLGYYDVNNGNIFIFADKIYQLGCEYLACVIMHEFIHALFDRIGRMHDFSKCGNTSLSQRLVNNGYYWNEETLDNLLVLLYYYSNQNFNDCEPKYNETVWGFIQSQPYYYRQAIKFFESLKEGKLSWDEVVMLMKHYISIK